MTDRSQGGHRLLITGISRYLGTGLAAILERHPDIDLIVAVDRHGPVRELARTDVIQAEISHSLIRKLVTQLEIDTVVHATVSGNTAQHSMRSLHDTNVIGTMNVLAGCGGSSSPVKNLVVLSDTAIYGGGPKNPALWTESMALPATPKTWYERDLREMERYVRKFQDAQPETDVSILRLADVIGPDTDSLMEQYLALPVIPTILGFDPVFQLIHQDDALEALAKATLIPHRGTFNVAPRGVIPLSQTIGIMGKTGLPVIPFAGQEIAIQMMMPFLKRQFPSHFIRFMQYGWGVDPQLWERTWNTKTVRSSLEAVTVFARQYRTRKLHDEQTPYVYQAQLEEFLRSKGNRALATIGIAPENGGHGDD